MCFVDVANEQIFFLSDKSSRNIKCVARLFSCTPNTTGNLEGFWIGDIENNRVI